MKFALKEYEASHSTGDFRGTQVSEARITYLAGNISRRIGNEKAAIKYFSLVFERQKMPGKPPSSRCPGSAFMNSSRNMKHPTHCCCTDNKKGCSFRNSYFISR
nr:DUF2225 domain-containing protein [Peribacillus sp. V2I11]